MARSSPEYWEKRIASNTWKTYNSLEEKNRSLLDFYVDASKAVKEELYALAEKYSKDGVLTLSEMYKQNRLKNIMKTYENAAKQLGQKVQQHIETTLSEADDLFANIANTLGSDNQAAFQQRHLMDKLLNDPWRGDSFSGRLWKNQKKLAVGLNDILLTGLQQGKTVTEMAVNLHNFMGQGFNNCHRLVRTETMHYLNSATAQRYKDADVQYVQMWAAQDERTCEVCGSYHEQVYPIDKCPMLPFHANCRCTIIPCFDEKLIQKYVDKQGKDDIIKADKIVSGHSGTPKKYKPGSVIDHMGGGNRVDIRTFYGSDGLKERDIHAMDHGNPKQHPYGANGEHAHDYEWDSEGKLKNKTIRELTDDERKGNGDIL